MKINNLKAIHFLAFFIVFVPVVHILPLLAKTVPAGQVCVSTPAYTPASSFNPLLGRYSYTVSWNGIPAASIELELDRLDDEYQIRASARTAKGIDIIYKLRYESQAVLEADTLRPKRSFSVVRTNSKKKTTELEFLPGGEILSMRKNDRGRVKTQKFDPDNFTLDPYSAGLLALSQEWKVGESRRFDMFSGKSRYLIEFFAVEQTELTVNERKRQAIVLIPMIKKLNDTEHDDKEKKLRQARIFISADQPRELLKVSSDLLFGSLDTEMVDFTPSPKPAANAVNKNNTVALGW